MGVVLNAASQAHVVGRYQLLEFLGSGGMSDVFVALHTGLRKRVALKMLRPHLRHDPESVRRFLREGECAARVSHPNVVHVTDVGCSPEGVPYLVMELLDGSTLEHLMQREGRLDLSFAVDLLLPVIDAVSATHAAGVLHRDIKPGNVLLSRGPDGSLTPKLVDFGIATLTERRQITGTLGPIGTPHYMSPEQARGGALDFTSDLYSLASVLFEMVTGRAPFGEGSVNEVLERVGKGRFPRARDLCPELPPELDELLLRATAFEPEHRYASTAEFARALVAFAGARTKSLWLPPDSRSGVPNAPLGTLRSNDPAFVTARIDGPLRSSPFELLKTEWWIAPLFVLVVSLCGVFALQERAASAPSLDTAHKNARAAEDTPGAATPRPETRRLVTLAPAQAEALLDGHPIGRGTVQLPAFHDDAVHELRVSARGYVTRVLLFRKSFASARVELDRAKQ
jgi:serine/threonine-protein kinase